MTLHNAPLRAAALRLCAAATLTGFALTPAYAQERCSTTVRATLAHGNTTADWRTDCPATSRDWIGLYRVGEVPGATPSLWWRYTQGSPAAAWSLPTPRQPGDYVFYYFRNDGYARSARSNTVSVSAQRCATATTASPAHLRPGERITVNWFTDCPTSSSDWVGVYANDGGVPAPHPIWLAPTGGGKSGTIYVDAPIGDATVTASYFPSGADQPAAASAPVQVGLGEGVRTYVQVGENPALKLWVVQLDLSNPRIGLRVLGGGADPDGNGPWQTRLATVPQIGSREGVDLAFNASFFSIDSTAPWPASGYVVDQPARSIGLTMTDGRAWPDHRPQPAGWPVLWTDRNGSAHITDASGVSLAQAHQAVSGNAWLVRDGKSVAPLDGVFAQRHPRTAACISADGASLTLMTVDGRQAASVGMTGPELANALLPWGCDRAINLDGGGSTTLLRRDTLLSPLRVLNRPSDGAPRPVANALGIYVLPDEP
ncbi:phosphodiester glycosidase family protein [Tahibacter amnicola]|uniref:Phosphodiester glycosidase family protein n=1 Tax=Tahibacter amnicola TaxID=2976241 RepID=A0ABY6BES1_9GAMM|nr:phosphodiester glycosidase family protein [Tahibacter amnicola]UXI66850.1 phosphodiester glycosidase family protein [Tahibacter amnicola]